MSLPRIISATLLIALMLIFVGCAGPRAVQTEPYDGSLLKGKTALESGDYAVALKELRPKAELGDADAQAILGYMYYEGLGVTQDYVTAFKWAKLAAEQENAQAQYNLGVMYTKGYGVTQDYESAVKWYRRAAALGHTTAQFNLGTMHYLGKGVTQDYKAAFKWTKLAAEQGHATAQYFIGGMYADGEGVDQDYKAAFKWFKLAAEQGYTDAQSRLFFMYAQGQGVDQDYKAAFKWFNLAAEQGDDDAHFNKLNAEEISESSVSKNSLTKLLKVESERTKKSIVISTKLLPQQRQNYYGPYDFSLRKTVEIRNWTLWLHREEKVSSILSLADANNNLLQKLYNTNGKKFSLSDHEQQIQFTMVAADWFALAQSFADICGIPIAKPLDYSSVKTGPVWIRQFEHESREDICQMYGLIFAVIGLKLSENDGMLLFNNLTDY